jgi:redox-sensitive bicupin YhaK (pirin superfamily)
MAKVVVKAMTKAIARPVIDGIRGNGDYRVFFDDVDAPIHLYVNCLAPKSAMIIDPKAVDRFFYVWKGNIRIEGENLVEGSSLIVERDGHLDVLTDEGATLVVFTMQANLTLRSGGRAHVLPADRVPSLPSGSAKLHADASCDGCEVWLHEVELAAGAATNVHRHTEDEVIFVTKGNVVLGNKSFGPGTAIAIAAMTMYSFAAGLSGLSFINLRGTLPRRIEYADGEAKDETSFWSGLIGTLPYKNYDGLISARSEQ